MAEVVGDHAGLGHGVAPRSEAGNQDRLFFQPAGHQQCPEDRPGGGKVEVQLPALADERPEGRGEEDPIVEQRDEGGDGHDLLAARAQGAGEDGGQIPGLGVRGTGAAHEAVEGQQEEQAHQGLGALDDVGDALGLKGVNGSVSRVRRTMPKSSRPARRWTARLNAW